MLQGILSMMVARHSVEVNGWLNSKTITIDHTKCGSSDSSDFPMLFSGTFNGTSGTPDLRTVANGGAVQSSNGYDIAFFSDSGLTTPLKFERVTWSASTGVSEFWVKIPTLSASSDTVIYLGIGNSTITTDQQDAVNVWTNNFAAVYHLPDGTTLGVNDSTGVNNGTNHGATATAGKIDGAANFASASSQYVDIGSNASLDITGTITLSAWVNVTNAAGANQYFIGKGYNPSLPDTEAYFLRINGSGTPAWDVGTYQGGTSYFAAAANSNFSNNTWYLLHGTWDGTHWKLYKNGSLLTTGSANHAPFSTTKNAFIGAFNNNGTAQRFCNGKIDEARIASTARNADWITAEYNNQNDPSTFYTIT